MVYVWLLLGFFLLVKGADLFVDGASGIAKLLRIPSIIIGLTVVAMGTSLPEASVSVTAALAGKNELSLSNVIGSNIFNLIVVVGASALLRPIAVQASVLKKDFPISIIITGLLLIMSIPTAFHGEKAMVITQPEGVILLLIFAGYLASVVHDALKHRKNSLPEENPQTLSLGVTLIYIVLGAAAIILGGNLVVNSASEIAAAFGLSQTLIGLTIVAIGTSLPELVTSVVAAKKGESDLALGNVVGSNIFNLLLVLGMSCALHPVMVISESVVDLIFLIVVSIIIYLFSLSKKQISRWEGALMLPLYILYSVYIIMR